MVCFNFHGFVIHSLLSALLSWYELIYVQGILWQDKIFHNRLFYMGKSTRMIPESHFWNFVLQLNDLYKCWVWIFSYREKKTASRFDLYISRYKACNQCHFDAKTACFKRHFSISCFSYIFAYGLHNLSCMIRLRPYLLKNATTNDLKLLVFKIFPIFSTKIDLCVTLQNITKSFFLSIFFIRFTWNSISRGFKH